MSDGYGPTEHHIQVRKTARYWTAGSLPEEGGEVWFVLHGYKQLARRFLRRFEHIAGPERLVVAPEALSRFYVGTEHGRHGPESIVGGTWMTREDRLVEIDDYVAYLDELARVIGTDSRRVTVLGFSQGVATGTRWIVQGGTRPARLLLWGEVTPPDMDLARAAEVFAEVPLIFVRGDGDRAFGPKLVTEEAERLASVGIRYEVVPYQGGHEIDPETLSRLAGG